MNSAFLSFPGTKTGKYERRKTYTVVKTALSGLSCH